MKGSGEIMTENDNHPLISTLILVVFLLVAGLSSAFVIGILVDLIQVGYDAGASIFNG